MQIRANQVMDTLVRVRDVTRQLFQIEPIGEKRERLWVLVAWLQFKLVVVDRTTVEAWGCTGFETGEAKAQAPEGGANSAGGSLAGATTRRFCFTGVHECL